MTYTYAVQADTWYIQYQEDMLYASHTYAYTVV